MQSSSEFTLLLDLDAMFDTRMGTLLDLHPDIGDTLDVKAYRSRKIDNWGVLTKGRVSDEEFKVHYAQRGIDILSKCIISGTIPLIMNYVDSIRDRYIRGVDITSISIDINTYPYTLPGPIADTLQNCLRALLPVYVQVGMCRLSIEDLSPEMIKSHYSGWVTYDIHPWLEVYHEDLLATPLNGLSVITPKLFKREPGESIDEEEDIFKGMDKHGLLEMVMEDFLHIEHINVSDFCFVVPGNHKLPDDEPMEEEEDYSSLSSRRARSDSSTDTTKSS